MKSIVNFSKIEDRKEVCKEIINFVERNFPNSRIHCLISYGSSLSEGEFFPKDYDFLLLLNEYSIDDYKILRKLANDFPIEFFIDYKDQILRKGISNYQRGRHGTYFFIALAYGDCLLGTNFYKENINLIPKNLIKKDLLFRLEEYFYRIQKHYLNSENIDIDYIQKYIARILFDLLLYEEKISPVDFHKIHYKDIINNLSKLIESFPKSLGENISYFLDSKDIEKVPELVKDLYELYLKDFDRYNKTYITE